MDINSKKGIYLGFDENCGSYIIMDYKNFKIYNSVEITSFEDEPANISLSNSVKNYNNYPSFFKFDFNFSKFKTLNKNFYFMDNNNSFQNKKYNTNNNNKNNNNLNNEQNKNEIENNSVDNEEENSTTNNYSDSQSESQNSNENFYSAEENPSENFSAVKKISIIKI
ncbi:hypothetical protein PIROE2DRAFT_64571 [Piromyces sp. E2]|nr:hypothetical protein PIROE2DRAFT_64571 [Piromyces sp. E2]|eukprot:OUM58216.1 hypothetical protein PIROE2DRAFT_64571 [Piromyces sp. E2]